MCREVAADEGNPKVICLGVFFLAERRQAHRIVSYLSLDPKHRRIVHIFT